MASASSTSAKHLFAESKQRLADRVHVNVQGAAYVCRQVVSGSRSADLLGKAARATALQDSVIQNTCDNTAKLLALQQHLSYQHEAIERHAATIPAIAQQVRAMQQQQQQ